MLAYRDSSFFRVYCSAMMANGEPYCWAPYRIRRNLLENCTEVTRLFMIPTWPWMNLEISASAIPLNDSK